MPSRTESPRIVASFKHRYENNRLVRPGNDCVLGSNKRNVANAERLTISNCTSGYVGCHRLTEFHAAKVDKKN